MSSEWQKVRIDEIGLVKSGKRLPLGDVLSSSMTPFPYIRLVDVSDGVIQKHSLKFLKNETRESIRRYVVNSGDVCLAIVGNTIGMVFFVTPEWDDVNLTENAARITGVNASVNSKYLYYYLVSPAGQAAIRSRTVGSAQGKLPLYNIRSLEFPLPARSSQDFIVDVLDAISNKISNLREMGATLEAIVQALFKSWFIDFDPVRAKMEGRSPEGMDGKTADLFPNEFDESELGMVPRGWDTVPLNRVLVPKNERVLDREIPEYASTNDGLLPRSQLYTKRLAASSSKNKVIRKGDFVFGLSREVLNFGMMPDAIGSVSSAYKVFGVDESFLSADLLERMIRSRANYFFNAVSASSREGQSVSEQGLGLLQIVRPGEQVQRAFSEILKDFQERGEALIAQVNTLTKVRDNLLPQLISGRLRIPDVEPFSSPWVGFEFSIELDEVPQSRAA